MGPPPINSEFIGGGRVHSTWVIGGDSTWFIAGGAHSTPEPRLSGPPHAVGSVWVEFLREESSVGRVASRQTKMC